MSSSLHHRQQNRKLISHRALGFTLIEVVAVLIILGILAAIAVNRIHFDPDQWINPDLFASHLRYAQSRAMATEQPWGLTAAGGTYTMFKVDTKTGALKTVKLPSEAGKEVQKGTWWFDDMGRPYGTTYNDTASPVNKDIHIKVAGKIVTITAVTGYVP